MKKITSLLALASLAVASCAPQYGPDGRINPGVGGTGITKQQIGTVAGALGGAFAAKDVGKGKGNVLAIAGGTVLGGLLGSSIGESLDRADMSYASSTSQNALEQTASGVTSRWTNPDSGNSGTITPVRTYQTQAGQYCREFNQTIVVGGKAEKGYGKACREQDGSWRIVSN